MPAYHIEKISVSNLLISTENPRFDIVSNQREAIDVMVDDQGEKLLNLASHIVESGTLNPSELPIVCADEVQKKKFNVLEGNRRVSALKLLETPDIISDQYRALRTKFRKL